MKKLEFEISLNAKGRGIVSSCIRQMMDKSNTPPLTIAEILGKDIHTFRNKLSKDTFSLQEVCVIASICGFKLAIVDPVTEESFVFHPQQICDPNIAGRYNTYKRKKELQQLEDLNRVSPDVLTDFIKQHPEILKELKETRGNDENSAS